jgi:pre-mRNA cleavage complex 2 protein Pcf11
MYQTFMNAYTLVDSQTRRKLDEMLKTWKEPVPGSLDTRPVFPPDTTRNIENALIKARTAALQSQQARPPEILRGRGSVTPTNWPTNPQPNMRHPLPNQPPPTNNNGHGFNTSVSEFRVVSRVTDLGQTPPPPAHRPDPNLDSLNRDLDALIASARTDFANSPFNPASQQRLKALLDLQGILQRQQLTQDQLNLVRDQISALGTSNPLQNAPANGPTASVPPPVSTPPTQSVSQPLQQLLNPGTLAELIKATAVRQQPTPPPQLPNALSQMPQIPQSSSTPQPGPAGPDNPLIAALRARGLLPPASAPPSLPPSSAGGPGLPFMISGQMGSTPPAQNPQTSNITSEVPMTTASIKM